MPTDLPPATERQLVSRAWAPARLAPARPCPERRSSDRAPARPAQQRTLSPTPLPGVQTRRHELTAFWKSSPFYLKPAQSTSGAPRHAEAAASTLQPACPAPCSVVIGTPSQMRSRGQPLNPLPGAQQRPAACWHRNCAKAHGQHASGGDHRSTSCAPFPSRDSQAGRPAHCLVDSCPVPPPAAGGMAAGEAERYSDRFRKRARSDQPPLTSVLTLDPRYFPEELFSTKQQM